MKNKTVTVLNIEVDEPRQMLEFWFNELAQVRGEDKKLESAHSVISIDDLQSIIVPNGLQDCTGADLEYDIAWDGIGWKIINARLKTEKENDAAAGPGLDKEYLQENPIPMSEVFQGARSDVAEKIDAIIKNHTADLQAYLNNMEGKILSWYTQNGKDPKFAEHFGIQTAREGRS